MTTSLTYVIKFVENMDKAVQFHVDQLDLKLRFQSPEWSEFDTGATTLALHIASAENPAGTCQLGLGVPDIEQLRVPFHDIARS
jgi:lactoylglutathione lyase